MLLCADTLIGSAVMGVGVMGVGVNLQRATLVILCEAVYDPKLVNQIPKRAYRLENKEHGGLVLLQSAALTYHD